ncbi:MAG TPA: bifunctional adenosylcobinamide kinase/adenosylcobinamide-phosphate guanylyltransferase [Candidatus Omnitrophica bacterium]|nr:bifunctional adenosylcobinamide kinase/adenosylcobinamide-phosphate guanylyltransferase [Candidatus Omnitrophota bacterium]
MSEFIFILGGARSGKSAYALNLAKEKSRKVLYIATAEAGDSEMKSRISKHKASRPRYWKTIEEPLDLIAALKKHKHKYEVIIIDCLTLYLSNLMHKGLTQGAVIKRIKDAAAYIKAMRESVVVISNEVGLGIVPENKLAREFRDIAGLANQIMAKAADEAVFIQAGIPLKLK